MRDLLMSIALIAAFCYGHWRGRRQCEREERDSVHINDDHEHTWDAWDEYGHPEADRAMQLRRECRLCGLPEYKRIDPP